MARKVKHLEFPVFEVSQGKNKLFVFKIPAKSLWKIVKINRRDAEKSEGYQRVLSLSRVKKIAKYIDEGNPIPNNMLISFDDAQISEDKTKIIIPNIDDAGWVIDGQHRLAGAQEAKKSIDFVVVAFLGLSLDDQIKLFIDINREQKGVPTSLYYDLLKYLPPDKSEADVAKERAADIADSLKREEDSPFFRRIVISSPKRGEISLTNFVRKVYPLVIDKKGKFHVYGLNQQIGIFNNYFKALENIFPNQFREGRYTFFRTLGFGAMMNAMPTVFDLTLRDFKSFEVAAVSRVLKTVDYFIFDNWDQYGTGNAAEIQAGEDFRQELLEIQEDSDESILKL